MDSKYATVELTTPPEKRRFLMGHDEIMYFIAQLPKPVTTVAQAHEALRPAITKDRRTKRQGEWFFVPTSMETQAQINAFIAKKVGLLYTKEAVVSNIESRFRGSGTPHIAEEWFGNARFEKGNVFVRGNITQPPRHAPFYLKTWHKVVRNLEVNANNMRGVNWID